MLPAAHDHPGGARGGVRGARRRAHGRRRVHELTAEDVRRFAEDPGAFGRIDPASGYRRILTDRYCLFLGPVKTFTSVSRLRLTPEDVPETLAEVRARVAEQGHRDAAWWVGSSASPADLVDRLRVHGLEPAEGPGWEAHVASMVLAAAPPPGPPGVEARRVASFDEFDLANRLGGRAFGTQTDDAEWEEIAAERYAAEVAGLGPRAYLAFADGEPVGVARASFAADCPAVLMLGGGVVPEARGRGVYRALVRARWDDAVAFGTPALCTQAGRMSRRILARLGFDVVAEQEILLDPATA